jgi:hypothetical protein
MCILVSQYLSISDLWHDHYIIREKYRNISLDQNTIVVDNVPKNITAIKYAWGQNDGPPNGKDDVVCCDADPKMGDECMPFQCPIIPQQLLQIPWQIHYGGLKS